MFENSLFVKPFAHRKVVGPKGELVVPKMLCTERVIRPDCVQDLKGDWVFELNISDSFLHEAADRLFGEGRAAYADGEDFTSRFADKFAQSLILGVGGL